MESLEPWLDSDDLFSRWREVSEGLIGRRISGVTYLQTAGIEMSAERLADSVHVVEMAVCLEFDDGSSLALEWVVRGFEAGLRLVLALPTDPPLRLAGVPVRVTSSPAIGRFVGAETESVDWLVSTGEAPESRSVTGVVVTTHDESKLTVVLGEPSDRGGFVPSPDTLLVFTDGSRVAEYRPSHSSLF
jgi:hypothetical protein